MKESVSGKTYTWQCVRTVLRYKRMKNEAKKAVSNAMRERAEDALTEL